MDLQKLEKEFSYRHDFGDSDLNVLGCKYPNIRFNQIPTAWIILLDMMLEKISDCKFISSITQMSGILCVDVVSELSAESDLAISICKKKIEKIDLDLWQDIGSSSVKDLN